MSARATTRAGLLKLLEEVENGALAPSAALEQLAQLPFRELGFARIEVTGRRKWTVKEVVGTKTSSSVE